MTPPEELEQALRLIDVETRAASILEFTSEGIFSLDIQGRITFANRAACHLIDLERDAIIGSSCHDLIRDSDRVAETASVDSSPLYLAYQRGQSRLIANEYLWRENGAAIPIEYSATPIKQNHAVAGAVIVFRDISDRKRLEDELRQAAFLSTKALELTGSGYWHVDYSDPYFYTQSELAARIVGEESKPDGRYHLQDEWFARLIEADPELARQTNDRYQGAIEGRYKNYDAIYPYKRPNDGRIVWLHASGSVVRDKDGNASYMYGVYQDITEAKQAEQAIKASEQRVRETEQFFRSVLELAPDGLMVVDEHGVVELVNAQCEKLFGCPRERLIGESLEQLVPSEERAWPGVLRGAFSRKPVTREMRASRNLCAVHQDGFLLPVEIGLSALPAPRGASRKIALSILDISQRKQHEDALEQAKAKAEEATEMKSMFLANMSHEMRTPMNAIIGLAHLALKTELTPKQNDYIAKVHGAGRSLLAVINDILDFSKIEAGKLDIENIDFKLDDVISSVTTLTGQKAHDKGLEFLADVPQSIPLNLVGDPQRLGQILTNLVNNAIKFTERGEVRLTTECVQSGIETVELRFSVRDTGIGMSSEQVGRLFQPFTQADMSTTRKHGGTGLGLTISRKLVEIMGGRIWIDSEAGVGSTACFTVVLGVGSRTDADRRVPAQLKDLNVLVVDDNPAAREVLVNALSHLVTKAHAVASGAAAVAAVVQKDRASPYDVIFMDWQMPGMDGLEAIREIKKNQSISRQPRIVLVTAFGPDEVREEAERLGVDGFFMKPVTRSMLIDALVTIFAPDSLEISRAVADADKARLRGIRILLAEDNEINQQIAVELLVGVGATVDVARDGHEAIEILKNTDPNWAYDLVLTDIQMPLIDGYQFSTLVRQDPRFDSLPIVAMTAHATVEERQRCLDAGMNDHISKPIDAEALYETVSRYCCPAVVDSVTASAGADVPPELITVDGLDAIDGLRRLAGNTALQLRLLKGFLDQQSDTATRLTAELAAGDYMTAERTAHTINGVAANLGAFRLQAAAAQLEKAIRARIEPCELEKLRQTFSEELSRFLAGLNAFFKRGQRTYSEPEFGRDFTSVQIVAAQMLKQLRLRDTAAVETLEEHREALRLLFKPNAFQLFGEQVQSYSFADALELLDEAIKIHGTPV